MSHEELVEAVFYPPSWLIARINLDSYFGRRKFATCFFYIAIYKEDWTVKLVCLWS